jgi:hypothetical protein
MFPMSLADILDAFLGLRASASTAMNTASAVGHIAGDPQGVPFLRFLAPQRGAALAASNLFFHAGTKGFLLVFITTPLVDAAGNDSLPTFTYIDVLDGDDLLAACPELV